MDEKVEGLIEQGKTEIRDGSWPAASVILQKAIEIIDGMEADDAMRGRLSEALRLRSYVETRMGNYEVAVADARRAMEISGAIGDLEGEADALRRLGYVHWRKGDNILAQEFYDNGLEKAAACGANILLGRILLENGSLQVSLKEFQKGERLFKRAIDILSREGLMDEVARATNNLGSCYMDSGDFERAIPTFEMCMEISESHDDILHKGWAAFNLGDTYTQMGQPEKALPLLDTAIQLLDSMNDLVGLAAAYLVYGKTYNMLNDWDKAEVHLNKVLELTERTPVLPIQADTHFTLGHTHLGRGDREAAKRELERSLEIYQGIGVADDIERVKDALSKLR